MTRPTAVQALFVAGLLAVFAAVGVQYAHKVSRPSEIGTYTRSAILRWLPQVQELYEGKDVFRHYNYPNPPIMAVLFRPFLGMPPTTAALTWFALKAAMFLIALVWVFRLVEDAPGSFPPLAKAGAVLLALPATIADLQHGNINLLILFLVVACLYAFHRGRDALAGVVLGLAVACKVTPALFLPYFLWKRAYRVLAGAAAGLVLFFLVVPGIVFGWTESLTYTRSWYAVMVQPFIFGGVVTPEHHNQSLPGLIYRLLTDHPAFVHYPNDVYTPLEYWNATDIGVPAARLLLKGLLLGFVGLVVWTCRASTAAPRAGWRLAAEYSLVVLGMLLLSERTWKHHAVTLIVPFAVLSYVAAIDLARRRVVVAVLAVYVGLTSLTSETILGNRGADIALIYGPHSAAWVMLAITVGWLLTRQPATAVIPILTRKSRAA